MIFPQLGPQYYNEPHRAILSAMEASYAEAITLNQSFWSEADTDTRFYAGDQSLFNDLYGNLPANRRRQFNFNRIRRIVDMIDGQQRDNRKSSICIPGQNGDQETADQYTKLFLSLNNQEGILNTISDAFNGALVTGMNLLHVWLDYRSDPINGDIRVDKCDYNAFLVDPFFKKADFSDCNFIWKRTFLTKREIMSLLPDYADDIINLTGNDTGLAHDGKFQFMPESLTYSMTNLLTYDEYYYRDYRTQKMLVDTRTGETLEWKSNDAKALEAFLRAEPTLTVVEQEIPTVKLAIVVQGKVFYDGPQPMGIDRYPFVPVLGYYTPQIQYYPYRIRGVVRDLRDSQYLYNRRKIIELDILESQINSGWIYKENALINPKDVFLSGQGRGLALKDEAQMTDVQQIPAARLDPSMIELSKILGQELNEISGVSEEMLGSADDSKVGILSMLRQGAGLKILRLLFDNLDLAQKLLYTVILELIQANYTPGKIKAMLEGEEPTPQFYSEKFGKYHISIVDGFNTSTQRQMEFAQLLQLKVEAGLPIPDEALIECATVQNKKQLIETMQKKQQQAQEAQQKQTEAELKQVLANVELTKSQSVANQGLGLERVSRIPENKALAEERRAEAIKDNEIGLLNLVKALKEIKSMDDTFDIEHITKLVQLSNIMKAQELQAQQASKVVDNDENKGPSNNPI